MSSGKESCALLCSIMAAVAVPFLIYLGVLCLQESHMIELPNSQKKDAAWGCFGSALLYGATFFFAFGYKMKASKQPARQVSQFTEMQQMARTD
mmetsp:Transcript_83435/g.131386  ORF Transcript_83435/g.131386 Transcript_83435/m.131386 type:complete len:94 (-) Transcript_83435:92-373(-)